MSVFQSFKLDTKELRGEITPTSATHISFECNSGSAGDLSDPRNHFLKVRGVAYGVHGHFYKWSNGGWGLGKEGDAPSAKYYHHLYINKCGADYRHKPSHAARVKAVEIMTVELNRWLKDNQPALVQAQQHDIAREIARREAEIAELESDITRLRSEIAELRKGGE